MIYNDKDRGARVDGRIWISIVTATGAFAVSLLCIYLGFRLFVIGATGGFKFSGSDGKNTVGFESVAPGLAFAFFGAIVAAFAIYKLVEGS